MPTQVRGEDGRVIAEKLGDLDALERARHVHANTGETVTLVPFRFGGNGYVLDEKAASTFGAPEPEPEPKKRSRKK